MMDLGDYRLRLSIFYELKSMGVNVAHTKSEVKARKKNSKSKSKADDADPYLLFGGRLEKIVERTGIQSDSLQVPKFLADAAHEIRQTIGTNGLFRIPGNSQRMNQIRTSLDEGKQLDGHPNDIASLIKAFFRELAEPLFTFGFFNGFIAAYKLTDEELRKKAVLMLCCLLDEEYLHTLVCLMRLLHDVAEHENNLMTASSLASILTPNLLRPRDQAAVTSQHELANHASCVGVVELLIEHADEIGAVPMEVVKAAQELKDVDKAKKTYLKLLAGRSLGWFSRARLPRTARSIRKKTNAVSVHTLHLLKRSEKEAEQPRSPTTPRSRLASQSLPSSPVQYSQNLVSSAKSPLAKSQTATADDMDE